MKGSVTSQHLGGKAVHGKKAEIPAREYPKLGEDDERRLERVFVEFLRERLYRSPMSLLDLESRGPSDQQTQVHFV